jgi:uncharacterized protein involved in exopolysaccharide biosynthesis
MDRRLIVDRILSRWWLIVVLTLLGGLVGYGRYELSDRVYAATSTLLIGRPLSDAQVDQNALETGQRLAATYADLATREPVLGGAVQQLGLGIPWQSLRGRVHATVPADQSPLVEITAEAASPEAATQLAQAIDDQLIAVSPTASEDQRASGVQSFVLRRLEGTQRMLADAQTRLDRLRRQEAAATGRRADTLRARVASEESHVLNLQQSYTTLLGFTASDGVTNAVSVLEAPAADPAPVGSGVTTGVVVGAFLGFLLGLVLAYIFGRRPRRPGVGGNSGYTGEPERSGVPVGQRRSTWTL